MGDRGVKTGRARVREEQAHERTCAVTRREAAPDSLIRFVATPDGVVVPDLGNRLPGRGVWLTPTREVVLQAVRQKAFQRSLKREVTAGSELADLVGALMLKRAVDHLALANKAGLVTSGATRVESAIEHGRVLALVHACDGADDGIRKLDQKFKGSLRDQGLDSQAVEARIVRILTVAELSLAIGRPNVVHAAVANGGAGRRFLLDAQRVLRYRLGDAASAAA
jgi:predicted RNA-binding protein YlxR (DUF448 family)